MVRNNASNLLSGGSQTRREFIMEQNGAQAITVNCLGGIYNNRMVTTTRSRLSSIRGEPWKM